jgi:RHS repeat-associated protein
VDYSQAEPAPYYYINDHLGAPVYLLTGDEYLRYELQTGPFGEKYGEFDVDGVTQPMRMSNQYADGESGMNYNMQRYYLPELQIYSQPDKLDNLSRANDPELMMASNMGAISLPDELQNNQVYGFVEQNPVNRIDRTGLSYAGVGGTSVSMPSVPSPPPVPQSEPTITLSCMQQCLQPKLWNVQKYCSAAFKGKFNPTKYTCMLAVSAVDIVAHRRDYNNCACQCQGKP